MADADQIQIGSGTNGDLRLYHESNISTIVDTYGDLRIMGNTIRIQRQAGGENFLYMTEGGTVRLHYDGIERLETTSAGAQIFNTLEVGNTSAPFLVESTTSGGGTEDIGRIGINRTNASTTDRQMWLQYTVGASDAHAAFMARSANDTGTAGTYLKVDAVNNNIDFPRDNLKLRLGAGNDLEIYHDGNSKIHGLSGYTQLSAQNGSVYIDGNSIFLRSGAGNENYIKCIDDGAVELYHNDSKKFETTSDGATLTGSLTVTDDITLQDDLLMGDTDTIKLGNSVDLQIQHDGTDSHIKNLSGETRIQCANIFKVTNYQNTET